MTGETIRDLLDPLIGKSGSISMIINRIGPIGFAATENKKLTGVEVRPDSLVRLERQTGWTVIDPGEVVAVGVERRAGGLGGPVPVSGLGPPGVVSAGEPDEHARRAWRGVLET